MVALNEFGEEITSLGFSNLIKNNWINGCKKMNFINWKRRWIG